jgi:hypothetical protein
MRIKIRKRAGNFPPVVTNGCLQSSLPAPSPGGLQFAEAILPLQASVTAVRPPQLRGWSGLEGNTRAVKEWTDELELVMEPGRPDGR